MIYVIAAVLCFICFEMYREWKFRKELRNRKPSRSFRVCEPGSDPQDRIEFHIPSE